jgi:hypothetical protein
MGGGTAGLVRNALGSVAVLVAVAGIAFGLPALDRSVPAERRLPAGAPYRVGGGVTLVPPVGATVDVARTRPRQGSGTAVFQLGRLRMAVQVRAFGGSLSVAADRFRAGLTGSGYFIAAAGQPVVASAGLAGVQGEFAGHGVAGRYAVFAGGGVSVEIMLLGPPAVLAGSLPVLQESLYSVEVDAGR